MFKTIKEIAEKYSLSEEDRLKLKNGYNELREVSLQLLDFIEENDVNDDSAYEEGCGVNEWRSSEFTQKLDAVDKVIKKEVQ